PSSHRPTSRTSSLSAAPSRPPLRRRQHLRLPHLDFSSFSKGASPMKTIRIAVLAMIALGVHGLAFSQATTTITATAVNAGAGAVTGTLCLKPVDINNNPISISKSGGGFYLAGRSFCQTLTAGSLAGSLTVPNPVTDSASLHAYDITIYDSTSQITTDLGPVYGIGGSSWSLDTYNPSANTPGNVGSNAITSAAGGSGTGTVTCLSATCTNTRGSYSVAG